MLYLDGFVAAVPAANEGAYRRHAATAAPLLTEAGCRRLVESWGDDIADGKVNGFRGAVRAEAGECVVGGWMEYPGKRSKS